MHTRTHTHSHTHRGHALKIYMNVLPVNIPVYHVDIVANLWCGLEHVCDPSTQGRRIISSGFSLANVASWSPTWDTWNSHLRKRKNLAPSRDAEHLYMSVYSSSVHVSQRPETSWNLSVTCPSLITVCFHTEDCAIMKPWQRQGQSPLSNAEFQSGWGGGKRSPRCCPVHTPLKTRQRSAVLFSNGNYAPNRGSVASGRGTPGDPVEPRNFCLDWAVTAQGLIYCPGPSICMSGVVCFSMWQQCQGA